jgi:hypothetical protein
VWWRAAEEKEPFRLQAWETMQSARGSRSAVVTMWMYGSFLSTTPRLHGHIEVDAAIKYATLCLEILYQVRRLVIDQQGITVSRLKSISVGGEAVSEWRRMICGP